MRARRIHFALLLLLSSQTGVASAQWFQVEVIAFRYTQQVAESWAAARALPDFSTATRLAVSEERADLLARAYQQLPDHELKLAGAYKMLARSGNLQPLFHIGWRQGAQDSRAVFLTTTALSNPEGSTPAPLEGTVRVKLAGEAFQLNSYFIMHEGDTPEGGTPIALIESRRVTLDELHYLDHPLVGFLIQVSALATPESDPTVPVESPATGDAGVLPD